MNRGLETALELLSVGTNVAALARHKGLGEAIKEAPKILKEDGPNLFGIGFDDERIWLEACLKTEAKRPHALVNLTALLRVMNPHEKYCLRMEVTDMKLPSKKDGNIVQPDTGASTDPRVNALAFLADLFDNEVVGAVSGYEKNMLARDTTPNEVYHSAELLEADFVVRCQKAVLELPDDHPLIMQAKRVREVLLTHEWIREHNAFVGAWHSNVKRFDSVLGFLGIDSIEKFNTPEGRGEIVRKLRKENDELEAKQHAVRGNSKEKRSSVIFWLLSVIWYSSGPRFTETKEIAWLMRFFNDEPSKNSECRRRDLRRMRPNN